MWTKIRELCTKYREIIRYLIVGVLTTAVSYLVYYLCLYGFSFSWVASQVLSWAGAVAFAFFVNRRFVFGETGREGIFAEACKFVGMRLASLGVETFLLWVLIDLLGMGEGLAKLPVSVLTVLVNYLASRLFIFTKAKRR